MDHLFNVNTSLQEGDPGDSACFWGEIASGGGKKRSYGPWTSICFHVMSAFEQTNICVLSENMDPLSRRINIFFFYEDGEEEYEYLFLLCKNLGCFG